MYGTEAGDTWSEYLKDFGTDGPLINNFDSLGSTSFFLEDPTTLPDASMGLAFKEPPTSLPIMACAMDEAGEGSEPPATISPATLLSHPPAEAHRHQYPHQAQPRAKQLPPQQQPSSSPSPGERAGAVQFMPHGGSLMALSTASPSVSQDSPLAGSLSQHSATSSDHPRRDAHMASEQRRRAIMRDSFERLQQLLPPSEYRKPSKANLLQAAVSYITYLKQAETTLRAKVQWLCREKALLNQQIHGTASPYSMPPASSSAGKAEGAASGTSMPPLAPAVPPRSHL